MKFLNVYRIVNSISSSNSFVLFTVFADDVWLVDCGDIEPILEWMHDNGKTLIKGVFITHSHYDHIYGLNNLLSIYPNLRIYTSLFGIAGLLSDKLNLSRYMESSFVCAVKSNIFEVSDNEKICLWNNVFLEAFFTPGHDKSCLVYRVDNSVFTGDSFIPGLKVVASFPNSNKEDAVISKSRILSLSKGCNLYPGHGEIYENFQLEKYI